MPTFSLDYSINVGNIASLVAILAVGYRMISSISAIELKVDLMWRVFERRLERQSRVAPRAPEDP